MRIRLLYFTLMCAIASCINSENYRVEKSETISVSKQHDGRTVHNRESSLVNPNRDVKYLKIKINQIISTDAKLTIGLANGDTILIKGDLLKYQKVTYSIRNNLPSDLITCEAFDLSVGDFYLKVVGDSSNFYKVRVNGGTGYLSNSFHSLFVKMSNLDYLLSGYPVLSHDNVLYDDTTCNSPVIPDYEEYSYVNKKVKGDWLKIEDDKNCPLKFVEAGNKIQGWVRWKEDDEIIIEVAHSC